MSGDTVSRASPARPTAFTQERLDWVPWVAPLERADADAEQLAAIDAAHGDSPYFRLLARAVRILRERGATDRGIFYTHGGLPRAERELSATAASKVNGCIFCASVHSHFAAAFFAWANRLMLTLGEPSASDVGWE